MRNNSVHLAMLNSYEIITYEVPFSEIKIKDAEFFAHDITKKVKLEDIENLLFYFEEIEDYEKCSRLLTIKNKYK